MFSVINGVVTMGTAHIGNLTIGTGKIANNAVTSVAAASYSFIQGIVAITTERTLLSITFTGSGSTAEVFGSINTAQNPSGLIVTYYLNGNPVSLQNYFYGAVHVFQTTTTVGQNILEMKAYKQANTGNSYIAPAYLRILELKK